MGQYFISPPEKTDLKIDVEDLTDALRQKWPDIEIETITNPADNRALVWTIQFGDRQLDGSLDKTGLVIHLDGDIRDCAEFAVWFRSQVPARYELIFYDESYSAVCELREDTTKSQIIDTFIHPSP
jgi:hypothetical protein